MSARVGSSDKGCTGASLPAVVRGGKGERKIKLFVSRPLSNLLAGSRVCFCRASRTCEAERPAVKAEVEGRSCRSTMMLPETIQDSIRVVILVFA